MDFKAARRRMVESQVRTNDVTDLRLQAALETIPREVFLPAGLREQAYVERELPYAPIRARAIFASMRWPELVTRRPFLRASLTWLSPSRATRPSPPRRRRI